MDDIRTAIPPEGQAIIANTEMALGAIELAIRMLAGHRGALEALRRSADYMDDVGGLLQPTFYQEMLHSETLKANMGACDAALAFLAAIDKVPGWGQLLAEVSGRPPG